MADTRRFPLVWPEGWARTPVSRRTRSRYKVTPDRARTAMIRELKLLGACAIIISTNMPVRDDGLPYARGRVIDGDPGVAVYWTMLGMTERVIACDKWIEVYENMHAIGIAVAGMRSIKRAGASQILERAFTAFGALPPSTAAAPRRPWFEVFGFTQQMLPALSMPLITARYKELATRVHPDRGGTDAGMIELNNALEDARAFFAK